MQQMNSGGQEQYKGYEGSQAYERASTGEQYRTGNAPGGMIDDDFMDAFAQRLSQRMAQGPSGKIRPVDSNANKPEYRLALAIVSIVLLVVLAIFLLISFAWHVPFSVGLLILGVITVAMIVLNVVYNRWWFGE